MPSFGTSIVPYVSDQRDKEEVGKVQGRRYQTVFHSPG